MRKVITAFAFLIAISIAASCGDIADNARSNLRVEKKYTLQECIVRVDFLWADVTAEDLKTDIIEEVNAQVGIAVVSGQFPIFSGHTTYDLDYYVFYFSDICEKRRQLTQDLIDKFFVPNVPGFPDYHIVDEGIDPGFDGVTPSGWWIDD